MQAEATVRASERAATRTIKLNIILRLNDPRQAGLSDWYDRVPMRLKSIAVINRLLNGGSNNDVPPPPEEHQEFDAFI